MCSTQWVSPVFPGRSFRLPTRYQVQIETIGAVLSSLRMTPKPLLSRDSTTWFDSGGAIAFTPRVELPGCTLSSGPERASHKPGQDRMQKWGRPSEPGVNSLTSIMRQEVGCGADRSAAAIPRLADGPRRAISANARSPNLSIHREL